VQLVEEQIQVVISYFSLASGQDRVGVSGRDPVALTVAIPTYNRRDQLLSLLRAVVPQLLPEDELVVVDDASSDGTAEAVEDFERTRLVRNERNEGLVRAWNACLASAQRPWVCIVHDDDMLEVDGLEAIRRACRLAPGPALVALRPEGVELDAGFRYAVWEPGPYAVLNATMMPSGATVHASIPAEAGGFDEGHPYSPDLEYFARVSSRWPILTIQSPRALSPRLHDRNFQFETWRRPDFLARLREVERRVGEHSGLPPETVAPWLEGRWDSHMTHMLRSAIRLGDPDLTRLAARELRGRRAMGRRVRLRAHVAAITGR
jgi:glycosyltransferase involved in cell wall biosynthesis